MPGPYSTLDNGGVLLAHDDIGTGSAVVLLHAGVLDRTMWADHLEPIAAAGYRVLAVDMPGFGGSPPAPVQTPWLDVLETIDALGIDRAALVGNSFGGAVALRIAALAPARVAALALISTPAVEFEPSERLEAAWEAEEEAVERGDIEGATAAAIAAWTLPDAPASLRDRLAAVQRHRFAVQLAGPKVEPGPDLLEDDPALVGRIEIPALVAAGEHDMPDFLTAADGYAQALPRAEHVVIAGAGHLAPLEQPDRFRAIVLSFLDASISRSVRI
jgi:pimeloyl-ACP methyl ester carboxylesterase